MNQTDSVRKIKGVGEKMEQTLNRLNIFNVADLVEHYPRNYDLYRPIQPIATIEEGDTVAIEGFLESKPTYKQAGRLKIIEGIFRDSSGSVTVTWFNMPFLLSQLHRGQQYIFRGKVTSKRGQLRMEQPKLMTPNEFIKMVGKMMPIYGLTAGLTNNSVQKAVEQALTNVEDFDEYLPAKVRKENQLMPYKAALSKIHFPTNVEEYKEARKRLVFDELFLYQMALKHLKEENIRVSGYVMEEAPEVETFLKGLPFELTNAQKKVFEEIKIDMTRGKAMNRLVQGDVGSGKTIVAILALILTVKNGYQGAFMVPTEVLAEQHYKSLTKMLSPLGVRIGLLTGSMKSKEKREINEAIRQGEIDVVVGTHALIQDKVDYRNLALVITDEQHRFGVRQRETLYKKGDEPHVLAMSATPIPRTLALVLYGDMDLSVMDELPANRLPIKNCVIGADMKMNAYAHMKKEIEKGHQVYVVCPMVDESENSDLENVTVYSEELRQVFGNGIRIEKLHGKMKPEEKKEIMESFDQGNIDILVSTTVIEVGIDVPNATTMLIENAERFGLATLHQLRGRVGRGDAQSYCILLAGTKQKEARERLNILAGSNDGFHIASEDLKLRGQGDLFGVRQTGDEIFRMADIYADAEILTKASEAVKRCSTDEFLTNCKKNERLFRRVAQFMGDVVL